MRRFLIACLVCAIGLSTLLAACGGSSSSSSSTSSAAPTTAASSAASAATATSAPTQAATTASTPTTASATSTSVATQSSSGGTGQSTSPPSTIAATAPTPTPAPTQASSSSTSATITRCRADNLTISLVNTNGAAGHIYGTYQLANKGNVACTLYGFIGAQMYDANDHPIPTNVVRNGGSVTNEPGPTTVTLAPGAGAPFELVYTDVPSGNETSCPKAKTLNVTPPNATHQLSLPTSIMPCNHGELDVSAVQQPALPATTPADRCHTNGLSVRWITGSGAAGHAFNYYALTNTSGQPCSLYGFVGGLLLDKSGKPLPTNVVRNGGMLSNQPKPSTVVLAPGAAAPFIAETSDVPTGNETTCEQPAKLEITPPNETTQLTIPAGFVACNHGTINVSPVLQPSVPPAT